MEPKWINITNDLYEKINPIGGEITSRIDKSFIRNHRITNAWVEFDMNEFIYEDPFYGEQKSTAPFRMNFSLSDLIDTKLESVLQIENQIYEGNAEELIGAFSNSLHFTIHQVKFGELSEGQKVDFEMTYSLTNSDSYGMMDGTLKDHIENKGTIKTPLVLKDLLISDHGISNLNDVLKHLNPKLYNINGIYESEELNNPELDYKTYCIPYSKGGNINHKWWNKLFK